MTKKRDKPTMKFVHVRRIANKIVAIRGNLRRLDESLGRLLREISPDVSRSQERPTISGETIGERIVSARKSVGLMQVELGTLAGISPATVCQIERGHIEAGARQLGRIAAALGVTVEELIVEGRG